MHPPSSFICEDDIDGGCRVMLNAKFDMILILLNIDVSTGDAITLHTIIIISPKLLTVKNPYGLWEYNIEVVMAD